MIRAAFVYRHHGERWLGGVSYLRNLLSALRHTPSCGIAPTLLLWPRAPLPPGLPAVEVRRTFVLEAHERFGTVWGALGRDLLFERKLRRWGVDLLSHSGSLGRSARLPAIDWIPDLQHRALPDLFSPVERERRDRIFARVLSEATRVIVSSETAKADVDRFYPGHGHKLRVLRFVDSSAPCAQASARAVLEARYGFSGRYFLLPNQYWAHKNHALVLQALELLRKSGREVLVLSTGSTFDYRHPDFFELLMRERTRLGLERAYRTLGVVPFPDLAGLFRGATAVLNPSLFEGWSTTVEEAKSLGKRVLLSDIPVHREQSPQRGAFFDPARPAELAELLWKAWTNEDAGEEAAWAATVARELPARRARFAEDYAAIARDAIQRR